MAESAARLLEIAGDEDEFGREACRRPGEIGGANKNGVLRKP